MSLAHDPTYLIVKAMLDRGNRPGLLREWFAGMLEWAEKNPGQDAAALRLWLSATKPRPFYTAAELAKMWPAFKLHLGMIQRLHEPPSANRLANELNFHGLPRLRNNRGTHDFFVPGRAAHIEHYFIVERCHYWRSTGMDQKDFENALNQ